ncbi:hypothetical protein D3C74_458430 [compost metagenome]
MGYRLPANKTPEQNRSGLTDADPAMRHEWGVMDGVHVGKSQYKGHHEHGNNSDDDTNLYFTSNLHTNDINDQSNRQHYGGNKDSDMFT